MAWARVGFRPVGAGCRGVLSVARSSSDGGPCCAVVDCFHSGEVDPEGSPSNGRRVSSSRVGGEPGDGSRGTRLVGWYVILVLMKVVSLSPEELGAKWKRALRTQRRTFLVYGSGIPSRSSSRVWWIEEMSVAHSEYRCIENERISRGRTYDGDRAYEQGCPFLKAKLSKLCLPFESFWVNAVCVRGRSDLMSQPLMVRRGMKLLQEDGETHSARSNFFSLFDFVALAILISPTAIDVRFWLVLFPCCCVQGQETPSGQTVCFEEDG